MDRQMVFALGEAMYNALFANINGSVLAVLRFGTPVVWNRLSFDAENEA
jgi:hypothetical protein